MATTYTWSVTNLYTIDASATETDYVVTALYLVAGTDGTYSAELSNSAQFEVKASEAGFKKAWALMAWLIWRPVFKAKLTAKQTLLSHLRTHPYLGQLFKTLWTIKLQFKS